jgi:hypothetical protein
MSRAVILYRVRSREDPTKWRSYAESFSRGKPFEDAQLWRNPKSAAKEAKYQEERRAWSQELVDKGVHKELSYMGPCDVVAVRIEEPGS